MPYKDPQRKRQWEREHRQRRNAARRMQRQTPRSGHPSAPKPAPDFVTALRNIRRPVPDPAAVLVSRLKKASERSCLNQKPKSTWKTILGWAVGIGVVLLTAFAAVNVPPYGGLGPSPG